MSCGILSVGILSGYRLGYNIECFMVNIVQAVLTWGNNVISPIITSMKSTHDSVPFKHSVVKLYRAVLW